MSLFLDDLRHALHFVVTHARSTVCRTYCAPLQISPKKLEKHVFYLETLRRKNGTDLVQNQPIEFEVVRLDRFCCPIALTFAVQNLCAVLLSHRFWRSHALTNDNLNVSHSTRFLHFLADSQVSPKFNESMLRVSFTHNVTKHKFDAWCPSFWMTLSCTAFCDDTRVHNLLWNLLRPPPDKPQKVRKTYFIM